jgi:hypothetical protein
MRDRLIKLAADVGINKIPLDRDSPQKFESMLSKINPHDERTQSLDYQLKSLVDIIGATNTNPSSELTQKFGSHKNIVKLLNYPKQIHGGMDDDDIIVMIFAVAIIFIVYKFSTDEEPQAPSCISPTGHIPMPPPGPTSLLPQLTPSQKRTGTHSGILPMGALKLLNVEGDGDCMYVAFLLGYKKLRGDPLNSTRRSGGTVDLYHISDDERKYIKVLRQNYINYIKSSNEKTDVEMATFYGDFEEQINFILAKALIFPNDDGFTEEFANQINVSGPPDYSVYNSIPEPEMKKAIANSYIDALFGAGASPSPAMQRFLQKIHQKNTTVFTETDTDANRLAAWEYFTSQNRGVGQYSFGGHSTLVYLSSLGYRIIVYKNNGSTSPPIGDATNPTIYLHHRGDHYSILVPVSTPTSDTGSKVPVALASEVDSREQHSFIYMAILVSAAMVTDPKWQINSSYALHIQKLSQLFNAKKKGIWEEWSLDLARVMNFRDPAILKLFKKKIINERYHFDENTQVLYLQPWLDKLNGDDLVLFTKGAIYLRKHLNSNKTLNKVDKLVIKGGASEFQVLNIAILVIIVVISIMIIYIIYCLVSSLIKVKKPESSYNFVDPNILYTYQCH